MDTDINGDGAAAEPMFRAAKRRKIFRKRQDSEDQEAVLNIEDGLQRGASMKPDNEQDGDNALARIPRHPLTKRRGITFSSTDKAHGGGITDTERALVPADAEDARQDLSQNDRFVQPTGRAGVIEDKHMMAYVESKLAETSSATATPALTATEIIDNVRNGGQQSAAVAQSSHEHTAQGRLEEVDVDPLKPRNAKHKPANVSSTGANNSRKAQRPPRRRRQDRAPSPSSLARSSLIDQILAESHVPIYQQTAPPKTPGPGEGEVAETDDAVAEAFKREFMAEIEERSMRARPPANPTDKVGPKLGGSRQQRERMARAQEAAAAAAAAGPVKGPKG